MTRVDRIYHPDAIAERAELRRRIAADLPIVTPVWVATEGGLRSRPRPSDCLSRNRATTLRRSPMPALKTKPAAPDDRLEEFHLWAGIETRPAVSRALRRLAWACVLGGALALALAVAMSGYL